MGVESSALRRNVEIEILVMGSVLPYYESFDARRSVHAQISELQDRFTPDLPAAIFSLCGACGLHSVLGSDTFRLSHSGTAAVTTTLEDPTASSRLHSSALTTLTLVSGRLPPLLCKRALKYPSSESGLLYNRSSAFALHSNVSTSFYFAQRIQITLIARSVASPRDTESSQRRVHNRIHST